MTTNSPWIRLKDQAPTEAGLYEWRVPSKAVPGAVLIVVAKMRKRGAGFESVLSPEFDYWDGYRVHVRCDVAWRPTDYAPTAHQRTPIVLGIEGLELAPCSCCGKTPHFEAVQRDAYGQTICPDPWNLNSWKFQCCSWGSTPWMADPREIERIRLETRGRAAPELLTALEECQRALEWVIEQGGGPACEHEAAVCFCKESNALNHARAAIAKATGEQQ